MQRQYPLWTGVAAIAIVAVVVAWGFAQHAAAPHNKLGLDDSRDSAARTEESSPIRNGGMRCPDGWKEYGPSVGGAVCRKEAWLAGASLGRQPILSGWQASEGFTAYRSWGRAPYGDTVDDEFWVSVYEVEGELDAWLAQKLAEQYPGSVVGKGVKSAAVGEWVLEDAYAGNHGILTLSCVGELERRRCDIALATVGGTELRYGSYRVAGKVAYVIEGRMDLTVHESAPLDDYLNFARSFQAP